MVQRIFLLLTLVAFTLAGFSQCNHSHCQLHKRGMHQAKMQDDPGNARSDTIDVANYSIDVDMTLINLQQIKASCTIDFSSKLDNVDMLHLDLLALVVDSVKRDSESLDFVQSGESVFIQLGQTLNTGDTDVITVFYQGYPDNDPQWGGFYFNGGYAYNLGVGFVANPHNFGRVWFPCIDNFVERSTYDVHVLTNNNRTVYCGGLKTGEDVVGQDSLLTHWQLDQEIPTYLASIAVSTYERVEDSFESTTGDQIPIWLAARAVDTLEMKNSMIHLKDWLAGAENHYGPYRWSRVGYVAVPFNGGAMEHATNIAYPLFAVDGALTYETLYAHELAHHWWGDLVTCRNADDMWLNEGWASFSEALFQEVIYGPQAYIDYVRDNHKDVLTKAHRNDGARYPVSGVPHELTYGDHVYKKGADVAHTLRGYMGDQAFFYAIPEFMDAKAFSDISSEDLRDFFQDYTTANLNDFFDRWVFEPGFPEFRVESFVPIGIDFWQITIGQYQHYAPQLCLDVPMQLTAMNAAGERVVFPIVASGAQTTVELFMPEGFIPSVFYLNANDAISMAILGEERWIADLGPDDFDFAEMDVDINALGDADSIFVRIENHWATAEGVQQNPAFKLSPDRWWNVITNAPDNAYLSASIRYYGDENSTIYYDSLMFTFIEENGLNEDSLVLMYRPQGGQIWSVYPDYTLNISPGGNDNWTGRFEINRLIAGQYAWAVQSLSVGQNELSSSEPVFEILQSQESLRLRTHERNYQCTITDMAGRTCFSSQASSDLTIATQSLSRGVYVVKCVSEIGKVWTRKFVLK